MSTERRASNRCKVHFAEIQVGIHPDRKLYPIKDISQGGIAFEYTPVSDETLKFKKIEILALGNDKFYLPQITCKTVYDIATLIEGETFTGGPRRIRGLKFVNLTKEQEDKLGILLNSCFDRTSK